MSTIDSMPAVNETKAAPLAPAVIRVEDVHKYYDLAETRVQAQRCGWAGA